MAEDFTSPVGIRSDTSQDTWSLTVDIDGNFALRSNSPVGQGEPRLTVDDDTVTVAIGTDADAGALDLIGMLTVSDQVSGGHVQFGGPDQRIEIDNGAGEVTFSVASSGDVRAGSNGENGRLLLYPAGATDILANADASVALSGFSGDLRLGGNGTNGDVLLRDATDVSRVRLSAADQRLEAMNDKGDIISMIGGSGNLRAGTNGEGGDLFLYSPDATNIFNDTDATVRLSGASGDMTLGGNDVHGAAFLNDADDTTRVRLDAANQRVELMSRGGEIIAMMGGSANIRAGTNGQSGDLFLYSARSENIFAAAEATVRLSGATGDLVLGGNDVNGDAVLRDQSGTNRVRLAASSQRLEAMNDDGEIIAMIGGAGSVRAGSNGENGRLLLYPSTASDIFDNAQAAIRMDGNSGDIVLQNADFAEDFDVTEADGNDAQPGTVMVLRDDGALEACSAGYDTRLVGVVSGAGGYKPGIVMDKQDGVANRCPIALVGKVFCRVDAAHGPIETGDLLTTSPTQGCAMRARDRSRSFGAVLGKALCKHGSGIGLVPVLVNLQ